MAGPTEARVRAALLRLWERHASGANIPDGYQFSWPTDEVVHEVKKVGERGPIVAGAVQTVGRKVAKGEAFGCSPSGWSELDGPIEYTYSRGTFTVRCRPASGLSARAVPQVDGPVLGDGKTLRHSVPASDGTGIKNRNVLGDDDLSIQVTWNPSAETALVTVRGKGRDLCPEDLRSFASALLEAAQDIAPGNPGAGTVLAQVYALGMCAERAVGAPRVTQKHLDLMRHATGGKLRGHRNYAVAPPDSENAPTWLELVDMGLAGRGEPPECIDPEANQDTVFHLTDAGFRMVYGETRAASNRGRKR